MTSSNGVSHVRPASSGPIPSAISAALGSNISLQAELKRRLLKIRNAQAQNRRDAARVAASISRCWNDHDGAESKSEDRNGTSRNHYSKSNTTKRSIGGTVEVVPKFAAGEAKRWCNPNRNGTRAFYTDPNGSTPETLWRDMRCKDKIEAQTAQVIMCEKNKAPIPCQHPQKAWDQAKRKNWPTASCDEVTVKIIDTDLPTQSSKCHTSSFTFADSRISKAKFTKQECLFIMSMIRKMGDGSQDNIDWYELAKELYTKFKRHTPWLCFSHYRSSLQNPASRCSPWSPDEDELLLKYLAVQGAQYLHQGETLVQICRNLFPVRNTKQLTLRAQNTLLNPNLVHDAWSADEKRKLALLMRVYSNEQKPLNFAARMFHFSNRSPKSVAEKWVKTLDPAVSYRPFTPDEDEELHESSGQWSAIGKKFPHRSTDSLKRRWAEIADERTVAKHCENRLITKALAKKGDSLLSPKDFMVLPQSKRKKYIKKK